MGLVIPIQSKNLVQKMIRQYLSLGSDRPDHSSARVTMAKRKDIQIAASRLYVRCATIYTFPAAASMKGAQSAVRDGATEVAMVCQLHEKNRA